MTTRIGLASIGFAMRGMPATDLMTRNNRPREDGRLIRNLHLTR